MRRLVALAPVLVLVLALAAPAAGAKRTVPQGFLGVSGDFALLGPGADPGPELAVMASSGVETLRTPFYWRAAQPYADRPPDLGALDALVGAAARRGLRIQPVVIGAPAWASVVPELWSPPRDPAAYGRFLGALARRYGHRGTFWRGRRDRLPITTWQVFNEPNDRYYWTRDNGRTSAGLRAYVAVLRAARRGLKAADPRARVLLAGLVKRSWEALERVYRLGGRRHFDAVAIHPFTETVGDEIRIIRYVRRVMARHGDARKPIQLTETTWTSARGRTSIRFGFEETEAGQARRLRAHFLGLARLRRPLRLERLFWQTWLSADSDREYPFDYAGLRSLPPGASSPRSKPALRAFRDVARQLEGCAKGDVATRCRGRLRGTLGR